MRSVNRPGGKSSEFMAVCLYLLLMVLDATPWVEFSEDSLSTAGILLGLFGGGRAAQKFQAIRTNGAGSGQGGAS